MKRRAVVKSIGHYTPERVLTNHDLALMVDTSDEWIRQRTGMSERRIAAEDQATSDLAILAAKEAIERAGVEPDVIDMIVVATATPDMAFPSVASITQNAIGAKNAGAFDVGAACAGFIYGTSVANAMIRDGQIDTALVIGAECLTKFTDYTDRLTCVLFGDGAGAVLLSSSEESERGVVESVLMADGSGAEHIKLEVGGSRHPACGRDSCHFKSHIFMNGKEVYRFAVKAMGDACVKVLEKAGLEAKDVDLFVPHQANMRIIESAAHRLCLPEEKVYVNIEKYGNTSAASIPIGLYEAEEEGRLKKGDLVMTVGFGAGLVWGANLICW